MLAMINRNRAFRLILGWMFDVALPRRPVATFAKIVGAFSATLLSAMPTLAQHQVEENAEHRTSVAVHVNEVELAKFLPEPWKIDTPPSGGRKGYNLILQFRDRIMDLDAEKNPVAGGSERGLILLVPARNTTTGETGLRVIREYTANPNFLPGLYKNSKLLSRMHLTQTLEADGVDPGIGKEVWQLQESDGGVANLSFEYTRGVPKRVNRTYNMYGSTDPKLTRIYHTDQGLDEVLNTGDKVDRTHDLSLKITIKELKGMFDGSEKMIYVEILPWYLREVSDP